LYHRNNQVATKRKALPFPATKTEKGIPFGIPYLYGAGNSGWLFCNLPPRLFGVFDVKSIINAAA